MRQRRIYAAIREAHEEMGYLIELACELLHAARSAYHGCTRQAKNPQYLAENLLDRQFYAAKPNEK